MCLNACERHTDNEKGTNNEKVAKTIKVSMDKKFGTTWHCIVGEGFSFEIIYELQTLMYMFNAGNLAICLWKCT